MIITMFGLFSKSKKKPKKGKKKSKGSARAESGGHDLPPVPETQTEITEEPSQPPTSIVSAQEKLDQAKADLAAGNFKGKASPADREAIIQQAMAVHKVQSKLLDELGEDTKQRLRTIAMEKVFKIPPKN